MQFMYNLTFDMFSSELRSDKYMTGIQKLLACAVIVKWSMTTDRVMADGR